MLDPRERFGATADLYHRHRPSYPPQLVDWVLATAGLAPPAMIADIGCGTGISTRLFAERGFDVTGVDPNEAMLEHARRAGGARYRRGEATATGLPDASLDLITVAQAFHWFDVGPTLAEFRRILRPGGSCAALWNLRAASPFLDEYDRLLRAFSAEYEVLLRPAETLETLRARPDVADLRDAEFGHLQILGREALFGRAHSSSYVAHGLSSRGEFDRALGELFDRHQVEGTVEFPYRAVALCWRVYGPTRPPGSSAPTPATG